MYIQEELVDTVMQWQNTQSTVWFQPEALQFTKMERVVGRVIGYLYNNCNSSNMLYCNVYYYSTNQVYMLDFMRPSNVQEKADQGDDIGWVSRLHEEGGPFWS